MIGKQTSVAFEQKRLGVLGKMEVMVTDAITLWEPRGTSTSLTLG